MSGNLETRRAPAFTRGTRRALFLAVCLAAPVAVVFSSDPRPEKRTFSEIRKFDSPVLGSQIRISAPLRDAAGQVEPGGALRWEVPAGWSVQEGSGMFTATFRTSDAEDADEGSIISLPGEAGGMVANAQRWLGQIGISLSADKVGEIVDRAPQIRTRGGFQLVVLDFNPFVDDPAAQSMLIAVARPGDESYFIKLMAPKANLARDKGDFIRFCESLEIRG
jgi:hypothetical protein